MEYLLIIQEHKNVGLSRDDGLGIFRNLSLPNIERKKKEIIKMFKSLGLSIAVKTNVTSANYLDADFDLTTDIYNPYRKPNNEPVENRIINLFILINIPNILLINIPQILYDKLHYE